MNIADQIAIDTKKEIKRLEKDIKNLSIFLKSLGKVKKNKYKSIPKVFPEIISHTIKNPIETSYSGKTIFIKNK